MKKYLIMLLVPLMMLASCAEDTSAYLPQEKEDVEVDVVKPDTGGGEEEEPVDGVLTPGVHLLKLNVDGVERRYKYFMPVSLDASKPISLIFEFHGSYEVEEGAEVPDPISGLSNTHSLNQLASKENCIVIFPAGTFNGSSVDWSEDGYMKSIPFVDAIIEKMKTTTPRIDFNRIYSTGQSSGAIFSWVLAFHRPDVFAAIAPRAGRMNISNETSYPSRAVPVRAFLGTVDDKVNHDAAVEDIALWANKIGAYFPANLVKVDEALEVEKYNKKITTRKYNGAKAPIEIYSIIDEGHNVPVSYMIPYMWEFFKANVMDLSQQRLFVTAADTAIVANDFDKFEISFNYTDGASLDVNAPADWSPVVDNKVLKLTAPDFFDCDNREGEIVLTVTNGADSKSTRIKYELNPKKNYYEVGDIHYNKDGEAIGVVIWIGRDPRKAKIINLQEVTTQGTYETIKYGDFGATFVTPDRDNGAANTAASVQENIDKDLKLTNVLSALIWAATYSYKGETDWYLPAINELAEIDKNLSKINETIVQAGGKAMLTGSSEGYLSSTVILSGTTKEFKYFKFGTHQETGQEGDNTSYWRARAIKMVELQ